MHFTGMAMTINPVLRDHVAAAILDAATSVLSEHPEASMADVAEAAGVGRATLYRYFLSRDHLVRALVKAALDDAHRRMEEADLMSVAVPDAIARLTRALVASGTKFAMLLNERDHIDPDNLRARLAAPIQAVFERGVADGSLRSDLPLEVLTELYGGLLKAAMLLTTAHGIGVERAAELVSVTFLDGTRPQASGSAAVEGQGRSARRAPATARARAQAVGTPTG